MRFDVGTSLSSYGTFAAPGTVGQPILFTRRDPADEWWGLYLYTGGSAALSYATVEYATFNEGYGISCNGAFPSLNHCTFRYNDTGIYAYNVTGAMLTQPNTFTGNLTHAVYFNTCSAPTVTNQTATGHGTAFRMQATPNFHLGTGNAITGNTWALTMDASSYPAADCTGHVPLAGNTNNDGLAITGGTTVGSIPWRDVDADYILIGGISIGAGTSLTVDPGVTVRFEAGTSLSSYGTFAAPGTVGQPILFTRRDPADEWWGIYLYTGGSATLSYATVEYATFNDGYGISCNGVSASLDRCTLRNNDYGLHAQNSNPHILRCTITNNLQYGVYLNGACQPVFGSGLTEWNDIHSNGGANPERDLRNGSQNIQARYVYWGASSEAAIEGKVRHELDDPALGFVTYSPWTNAAHTSLTYWQGTDAGDDGAPALPTAFAVEAPFPNPFNPAATFAYALPVACRVRLDVFDEQGRRVATPIDEQQAAGYKTFTWRADGLPAGVYFARLQAGGAEATRKLVLLK